MWLAATAGSIAGGAADLAVGRWIARGRLERLSPRTRAAVDVLVERFRRYGAAYLALNRFVPGVRAAFFVAAGLAGLRTGPVLGWAAVSAIAWNTLLVAAGFAVGADLERLAGWFQRYQAVAWVVVAAGVAIAAARWRR